MSIITITEVRQICGVKSDIIDDATITGLIAQVENETYSNLKVYPTPTKVLEIRDGNNKNQLKLNRPYVWKVLELKSKDNDIDVDSIKIDPISSIITIDNYVNPFYFFALKSSIKIKYLSAFMEKTDTLTEVTNDIIAGDNIVITLDDDLFAVDDWVLLQNMDGFQEVAKVTVIGTNLITVDNLVNDYDSGSMVIKLQTHELLKQFILKETAVAASINSVGGSYNFATGYTFPEYSVQKGQPYMHFVKTIDDLLKQRDIVKRQLYNKLNVIS